MKYYVASLDYVAEVNHYIMITCTSGAWLDWIVQTGRYAIPTLDVRVPSGDVPGMFKSKQLSDADHLLGRRLIQGLGGQQFPHHFRLELWVYDGGMGSKNPTPQDLKLQTRNLSRWLIKQLALAGWEPFGSWGLFRLGFPDTAPAPPPVGALD